MARSLNKFLSPFGVMIFEAALAFTLWLAAVELRIVTGLENAPLSKDYWHYGIVLAALTVVWQSRNGMYQLVRQSGRFEKIETLLELKWWDWDIEKITKHVADLTGDAITNLKAIANEK